MLKFLRSHGLSRAPGPGGSGALRLTKIRALQPQECFFFLQYTLSLGKVLKATSAPRSSTGICCAPSRPRPIDFDDKAAYPTAAAALLERGRAVAALFIKHRKFILEAHGAHYFGVNGTFSAQWVFTPAHRFNFFYGV